MSLLICLFFACSFFSSLHLPLTSLNFLIVSPFLSQSLHCLGWGVLKQPELEGNEPNKSSSCPRLLPARASGLPSSVQLRAFTLLCCKNLNTSFTHCHVGVSFVLLVSLIKESTFIVRVVLIKKCPWDRWCLEFPIKVKFVLFFCVCLGLVLNYKLT